MGRQASRAFNVGRLSRKDHSSRFRFCPRRVDMTSFSSSSVLFSRKSYLFDYESFMKFRGTFSSHLTILRTSFITVFLGERESGLTEPARV